MRVLKSFVVRDDMEGSHDNRMKIDGPSWNGLAQSRPKMVGQVCMKVQFDMHGGEMVMVEEE